MSTPAPSDKTYTVGYFNPSTHEVHVVISKFNLTLRLLPGKYIEDTAGRKINDPFFDAYKALSKETGTTLVPVVRLAPPQPPEGRYDGHSVRQVTEFTKDAKGRQVPVMPERTVVVQPSGNQSSVRSMSIEEARRLGLIKPTRNVPEDYGVKETDGIPPSGIPPMKLATDVSGRNASTTSVASTPVVEAIPEANDDADPVDPVIVNPISTEQVQAIIKSNAQSDVVTAVPAATDELPAPNLTVDKGPDEPAPKFVCPTDGKTFDSFNDLSKHVRKTVKDIKVVQSILASYAIRPIK